MNKLAGILLLTGFICWNGSAKQRTASEALNVASGFISMQTGLRNANGEQLRLAYSPENTAYYVFNNNRGGFVIISGDDRAQTILGYSDEGQFDATQLPSGFQYWLSCYEKEITAISSGDFNNSVSTTLPVSKSATSVAPLLKTQWNQDRPYNNFCPLIPSGMPSAGTRTVTGCVATAMAQIMKHHQYPAEYHFSKQYATATLNLKINETLNGVYDWSNMLNKYNSSASQTQQNAVAQLTYHCGIAVEMDYNTTSGAHFNNVAKALPQIFGYDANLQIYQRDYYSRVEWETLITNELNQNRPVYYAGVSSAGGHAFVCDGYDTNRFFHINWGWGGASDGYFVLSALNPPALGIGGGTGGGFNFQQAIIIGIQAPNTQSVAPPYQLLLEEAPTVKQSSVNKGSSFTFSMVPLWNGGVNTFYGDIGAGIFNSNNQIITTSEYYWDLPGGMGWNSGYEVSVNVPGNIANGDYRVYPVYRAKGSSEWQKIRVRIGLPAYVNMSVSGNKATFSESVATSLNLPNHSELSIIVSTGELQIAYYQDIKNVTIVNLSGNVLLRKTVNNQTAALPVDYLSKGLYIIKIETDKNILSTKFIIR
ncbi:MAG: thiol protease/hemagglutinin PrtT [Dysgonamonadaceae bacterium]|jgi:hypothetical protein|nr:thiol protease/hemagglutinin PrtT [Dysgonamonadaceae bacterium]